MSRATISGPVSESRVLIGWRDSFARISRHRPRQIDLHDLAAELRLVDLGQELRRVGFELLEEDAVACDLAEDLAVGASRTRRCRPAAGAVARQADDAHVVAEIFAAELRADADLARHLQHLALQVAVAEGLAVLVAVRSAACRDSGSGELHRLQVDLGRGAADDDGEVIGRAGGGAERADLLVEEFQQRLRVQHRLGFLEEEASCWPSRRPWR